MLASRRFSVPIGFKIDSKSDNVCGKLVTSIVLICSRLRSPLTFVLVSLDTVFTRSILDSTVHRLSLILGLLHSETN